MPSRKLIEGRAATQQDVDENVCVFFVPDNRSRPFSLGSPLPLAAKITKPSDGTDFPPPGTLVEIVQAEIVDDHDVLLGFVYGEAEGLCGQEDVEIIEH